MKREDYIHSLTWRLDGLRSEIETLRKASSELSRRLKDKEDQAARIIDLLSAEGAPAKEVIAYIVGGPLADAAYRFLAGQGQPTPIHYRELATKLVTEGIAIPGKEPAANLLSHIVKDPRFVRLSPGTYGLHAWGLQPRPKKARRMRKARRTASRPKGRQSATTTLQAD